MNTGKGETPLTHLRRFLELHRAEIGTVAIYSAAVGVLVLATPIAVQALVSSAAFGTVLQPIVVIAALLLGGLVFAGVLRALKSFTVEVLQQRMFVRATSQLAYRLPRALPGLAGAHPVHRYLYVFTAQKAASTLLLTGIDVVLSTTVGTLVLAFYHPVLLAFDAGLLLGVLALVFVAGRGGVRTAIEESSAKLALSDFLADITQKQYAFRDAQGRAYAHAGIDGLAERYLRARNTHFRIVLRQIGGAVGLQAIASAALLGLGGWLVIERELTLGQLVAAELIVSAVLASLSNLGKYAETYYDLVASLYKLHGLLGMQLERDDARGEPTRTDAPCEVQLEGVRLSSDDRVLLDGASLHIPAGARVLVRGPASAGKTALLELLFGLRRQERGRVLVDAVDARELSRDALRTRVALVGGPEILPGTVLENVRLGDPTVPVERVRGLLEQLGLAAELEHLPEGLETPLGPDGSELSTSQALRLTLARALVRNPGLVALDADLGYLDDTSWERVQSVLTRERAPWTLVVVGDHPRARALCTDVLNLEGGALIPEADHVAG